MKSVHLCPSIVQEAFCRNILSLHSHSVRGTTLLGDHAFWIVSKLGKKKILKHSFVPISCHISVFKKVRPDYLLYRQVPRCHNWWEVLKRLIHLVRALTSPDSAKLLVCWSRQRKLAFIGENNTLHHFLAPFENIEQNCSFSFYDLPSAM